MRAPTRLGIVFVVLAACGGGDDSKNNSPDAAIDAPSVGACGATAAEIGTYPGMFAGHTVGAGADLTVAMGACADERLYFGDDGEDQVVKLSNLTAGTTYVIDLDTTEDLTFYVTGTCTGNMPAAGSCLLHVDQTTGAEEGEFVAPAGGEVFVIVDSANDPSPPTAGDYTLHVKAAECTDNTQCTTAGRPICDNFTCVQCTSSFDCSAGAPVCDANACVAGGTACTGDDTSEPDDGPTVATVLTLPTTGNPTVVNNHLVCSQPASEDDWYRLNIASATSLRIGMSWTNGAADLDFIVYDSTGTAIDGGIDSGPGPEAVLENLAVGTYYIEVYEYSPANVAAATPYTLTLALPDCATSFNCQQAAAPLCDTGLCIAGPTQCTGDDPADGGTGDDGPAAARSLTGAPTVATQLTGSLCNTPGTEFDWYKVTTTAAAEGIHLSLDWTGTHDLDIAVFSASGQLVGLSFWLTPEQIDLSYLPGNTYYVRIALSDAVTTAAVPYTVTATRLVGTPCLDTTNCAATYSTQIYRGNCSAGACQFIAPGTRAANAACDSADDCASTHCSYSVFESDAQKSVCTVPCNTTTDCSVVAATGLACTTGFGTNLCLPVCTTATECGANTQSSTLDVGTPWDYFTCTPSSGACSP